MSTIEEPLYIFCSFASDDGPLFTQLYDHLRVLEREGRIAIWHQRLIGAGTDWTRAVDRYIAKASIILLLISPAFIASDYCYGVEMRKALQRHEANQAQVIPILVRPVNWKDAPFSHLSVLPINEQPLTLWNNQDAAFANVATHIRHIVEGLRPFHTVQFHAEIPAVWNVPFSRNPFFTGQEALLTRIANTLANGQSTALSQGIAINGLGGIGKTQVVVEYAYRHWEDYQAVLWCRADANEALISGYVALAKHLHLPEQDVQDQTMIVQAVRHWLATHTKWLLILDNVDDLSLLDAFLPVKFNGHLLLTTRAQAIGRLAYPLEINPMEPDIGALLLLRRARLISCLD